MLCICVTRALLLVLAAGLAACTRLKDDAEGRADAGRACFCVTRAVLLLLEAGFGACVKLEDGAEGRADAGRC